MINCLFFISYQSFDSKTSFEYQVKLQWSSTNDQFEEKQKTRLYIIYFFASLSALKKNTNFVFNQ